MAEKKRERGALWQSTTKKAGYGVSRGSYNVKKGDRFFVLKNLKTGKTRVYESPKAAMDDGWVMQK